MLQLLQTGLPPSNLPYLIAAFVVTGVVFIGYIYFIFRRRQETYGEITRLLSVEGEDAAPNAPGPDGKGTGTPLP